MSPPASITTDVLPVITTGEPNKIVPVELISVPPALAVVPAMAPRPAVELVSKPITPVLSANPTAPALLPVSKTLPPVALPPGPLDDDPPVAADANKVEP